jgi:D-aminopeptidase
MSDKVELIAAARVNVVAGSPGAITFKSNFGFDTASRGSPGVYELMLEHSHNADKLVVNVTRDNAASGEIAAMVPGTGDVKSVQVSSFNADDAAEDTSFFISVLRVRS